MKKKCASYEEENQRLKQANQHLKEEHRDYDQQIESLNEEHQRLKENNQRVKQENYDFGQQIGSFQKEKQRLLQDNRRLEQEIQECKKKIDDLKKTIPSLTEPIGHQNLRTTASISTSRTSSGASTMATSKCKFESKSIVKNIGQQLLFVLRKITFKSCY